MASSDNDELSLLEDVTEITESRDAEVKETFHRSEFAAVVFHNIAETYPADAHIECTYTITSDFVPHKRDYVGLYRVGWITAKDYIYYEWAPYPKDYQQGKEAEGHVLFPAHKLPDDDGEFYQFCYVSGQVRGASTPFQFKKPRADDYIEVEGEEPGMLVIRSKAIVLQENLSRAEDEKKGLMEMKMLLEKERHSLIARLTDSNKALREETEHTISLQKQLTECKESLEKKSLEIAEMEKLQKQLETITKEKELAEEKVEEFRLKVTSLSEELEELRHQICRSDEMVEKKMQESVQFKSELEYTQESKEQLVQQLTAMKESKTKSDHDISTLSSKVESLKKTLKSEQKKLEKQKSVNSSDKEQITMLHERLKNSEDKLAAAEKIKVMMQDEITSYTLTQKQLSSEIEMKESECFNLREKMSKLDAEYSMKFDDLQNSLKLSQQESNAKDEEIASLKHQMNEGKTESASLFHMKEAQKALKERYGKLEKQCSELQDELIKVKKQSSQKEHEYTREIEDLKERIDMCSEEYKALYLENKKLLKKRKSLDVKDSTIQKRLEAVACVIEKKQTSVASPETGVKDSPRDDISETSSVRNFQTDEIQESFDDIGKELERRQARAHKYKKLYNEEKEQQETIRKLYYAEQKKSMQENEILKKKIEELQNESELKMRSMQNFLTEKDREIDDLRRRLRMNLDLSSERYKGRENLEQSEKSPSRKYPYLMYGNPTESMMEDTVCCIPQFSPLVYPHPQTVMYGSYPKLVYPSSPTDKHLKKQDEENVCPPPTSTSLNEEETDGEIIQGELQAILTPLPAPLEPEKLPTAKLAAVKAQLSGGNETSFDLDLMASPDFADHMTEVKIPPLPSAPRPNYIEGEDERFVDALGDGMKMCPVCKDVFAPDKDQSEFDEHILSHFGKICPVCKKQMDIDTLNEEYEGHVNACLTDAMQDNQ